MESANTYWADRALLEWQVELGADEAIGDLPVDRYALDVVVAKPVVVAAKSDAPPARPAIPKPQEFDAPALAREAAQAAGDLAALAQAQERFELCEMKRGAKSFVFADGQPAARVMIVGEAPGREEDQAGRPFVGQEGVLLDRMLAAIGLDRGAADATHGAYLTTVVPWRPLGSTTPGADDIAMMLPFLERHIALANPDVVVCMGNAPCLALLGEAGVTRIRGQWGEVLGRPALPMFHPTHLLRQPGAKRDAWADLLALQARLRNL